MSYVTSVSAVVLTGILLTGCAHGGHRADQADALKTRVDSLESQVASLNQRVEELNMDSSASEDTTRTTRTAKPKTLSVRQIQRALASAGYYKGTVDGKQGPQTRKAIKAFQEAQGLKADGIVGIATQEALAKYLPE